MPSPASLGKDIDRTDAVPQPNYMPEMRSEIPHRNRATLLQHMRRIGNRARSLCPNHWQPQQAPVSLSQAVQFQLLAVLRGDVWVHSIAFSPEGNFLAAILDDNTIRLWHLFEGSSQYPSATFRPPRTREFVWRPTNLAFQTKQPRIAVLTSDILCHNPSLLILDYALNHLQTIPLPQAVSRDGRVPKFYFTTSNQTRGRVSLSGDHSNFGRTYFDYGPSTHRFRVLDVESGLSSPMNVFECSPQARAFSLAPDSKKFAIAEGGQIYIIDGVTAGREGLKCQMQKQHPDAVIVHLDFAPGSQMLASSTRRLMPFIPESRRFMHEYAVQLWDAEDGSLLWCLPPSSTVIRGLAVSPNERFLAILYRSYLALWDLSTRQKVAVTNFNREEIGAQDGMLFSSDSKLLATRSTTEDMITVWRIG